MGQSTLRLVVDSQYHIPKSNASTDLYNPARIDTDILEIFEVIHHAPVLTPAAEACVGVAAALGLNFDIVLSGTEHSIRDILRGCWENDHCWDVLQVQIERFSELPEG